MLGVVLLHEVSKKNVGFKSVFCFKVTIMNDSENDIENVSIANFTTVSFDKNYYEFEKNIDSIEIFVEDDVIMISKLNAKAKVVIYITTCVTKIFSNSLVSFARADYKENSDSFKTIRSNESCVDFVGSDFTGDGFKVSVSKNFIDYDEIFDVSIDICNKGTSVAKDVSIFDFISDGCFFVEGSLFINGANIDVKENLSVINLSDIMPFSRMKISLKVRAVSCKEKFMQGASILYYDDIDSKESIREEAIKTEMIIRKIEFSNFVKRANKNEFKIDEEINFKILLANESNIPLLNIKIDSILSDSIQICTDSFFINGKKSEFEGDEIQIPYLNEFENIEIEYRAIAKKCEKNIESICNLSYKYVSSDGKSVEQRQIISEQQYYSILGANLEIDKSVNKNMAFIGDEILFNISLCNSGNVDAKNIKIFDEIFEGFEIIDDMELDNNKITIENGYICIDEIQERETKNIRYLAKASMIVDEIQDYKVSARYDSFINNESYTNTKMAMYYGISVRGALINEKSIKRIFDSKCVSVFDEMRITSFVCNNGNLCAKNVSLKEIVGEGFSFVIGSLYINGSRSFLDMSKGIVIGDLDVGEEVKLEYRLLAERIIFDKTTTKIDVSYLSQVDGADYKRYYTSKNDEIFINCAYIGNDIGVFEKSAKNECCVLDDAEVRMILKNTGNKDAFNILIEDFLDEDMKICSDMIIRGRHVKASPYINIDHLQSGESVEVYYKAKILETQKRKIKTSANVTYNYYVDSIQKINQGSGRSNEFCIDIFDARVNMLDNISTIFSNESEQIVYNLYVNNIGNVDIENAKIKINIDDDIEVHILECTINGLIFEIQSLNEIIDIKKLREAQTTIISLRFTAKSKNGIKKAYIDTNFEGEYISYKGKYDVKAKLDKKEIFLSDDSLIIEKTSKKKTYLSCDDVDYIVCVKNNGTSTANNLLIYDEDFKNVIDGSVKIDGIEFDLRQDFINIEMLEASTSVFITYSCRYEVKTETFIKPKLSVKAWFCSNFLKKIKTFNGDFNGITVRRVELSIVNTTNKNEISYDEKITITSMIINKGSLDIYDLYVEDFYDKGFKRLEGNKDFEVRNNKLYIPVLRENDAVSIKKQYLYESYKSEDKVEFKSFVSFMIDLDGEKREGSNESNILVLDCKNDISKSMEIEAVIKVNDYKISEVVDVTTKIQIDNYYFIKTMKSKIYKDNILTGKKMILRGHIDIRVQYIEEDLNEQIRIAKYTQYFSKSIVVIEEIEEANIEVRGKVCDVFYRQLDSKRVLTSSSLFIDIIV